MVKQQKIVRDAGGPSKRPAVVISGSFKQRNIAPFNAREKRLAGAVLRMLSQKRPESETEAEPDGPKVGDGTRSENGAVTPGSYTNGEGSKEFLSTGRTGRRNAMPDILGHHADTGTADLSTRLEALTTKHDEPGTSGLGRGPVSSSSHQQMG